MAKTSKATATKWWNKISVTRNSNGSYNVNGKNYSSISAAQWAIRNAANSSWWTGWWNISWSNGKSYTTWNTSWTYRWAGWTWLTNNNYDTKYANNSTVQSLIGKYWKDKVYDVLDYVSWWGSNKSQISYLLTWDANGKVSLWWSGSSSGTATPTTKSKVNDSSIQNFTNAREYYISQWMSPDKAYQKALTFLNASPSTKSEQQKAEEMTPVTTTNDEDTTDYDELLGEYAEGEEDTYNPYEDIFNDYEDTISNLQDQIADLTTKNTESQVVENKAEVSKDPIFDYNTYFKENLAPDANVWETGEVKSETVKTEPLTDVTKYQDEAVSSLQSLGFLEPNTSAAESMPDTVEQTQIQQFDTPEQLVQDFNAKIESMWAEWEEPNQKDITQIYIDYKNNLLKLAKDKWLSEEQIKQLLSQMRWKANESFI